MKRVLILLLTLLITVGNCIFVTKAESFENIYVLTIQDDEFDQYAVDNAYLYAYAAGDLTETSDIKLGKGILIYNQTDIESRIYPIWKNGEIIAQFEVHMVNGELTCAYTHTFVDALNYFVNISTLDSPVIICNDGEKMAVFCGNQIYSENSIKIRNQGYSVITTFDSTVESGIISTVSLPDGPIDIQTYISRSWTDYAIQTGSLANCVPICLFNIFRNNGALYYSSWTSVKTVMDNVNNVPSSTGLYGYAQIETYLNYVHVNYTPYSHSGKLSITTLSSIINGGDYVMAISGGTNGTGFHATVCIGFQYASSATIVVMFDPHASSLNSHLYVNYNNPIFTSNTNSYIWNKGYYSYLN